MMTFPCHDFSLRRVAVLFSVPLGVVLSFAPFLQKGLNVRLELTELWATELPDSISIGGAFPGPDGSVTVWAQTKPVFFLFDETGTLREVTSPKGLRGRNLVPTSADPHQALFDADECRFVGVDGSLLFSSQRYDVPGLVTESAAVFGGHVFLGGPSQEGYSVTEMDLRSGDILKRISAFNGEGLPPHSARLVSSTQGLFLAFFRYPFTVHRLEDDGVFSLFFDASDVTLSGLKTHVPLTISRWISLSFLPLGEGFLVEWGDPNSDERLILTLNSAGQLLNKLSVQAPLGFVTADPNRKVLHAIRSINGRELAAYTWRWVEGAVSSGQ